MDAAHFSTVRWIGLVAALILALLVWGSPSPFQGPAAVTAVPLADADNDGLADLLEAPNGCDPAVADTDSDGLTDGQEAGILASHCNKADIDADGFEDAFEARLAGTVTSAGPTSLTDTSQSWVANQWLDYVVAITAGVGAGQTRAVISNSPDTIDVSAAWAPQPGPGSEYVIQKVGTDPRRACAADNTADNEDRQSSPTDLNDDRSTNILDVFKLLPSWLVNVGDPNYEPGLDLNADKSVNILDVFVMLPQWLDTCTLSFNLPPAVNLPIEPERNPAHDPMADSPHNGGFQLGGLAPTRVERLAFSLPPTSGGGTPSLSRPDGAGKVYLHSGEFYLYEVDLVIPGRGIDWMFARKYRSGIEFEGLLGRNWDFNYNRRLFLGDDGNIVRLDGHSRSDLYVLGGGGQYISPTGFYTELVENLDDTFTERAYDGMVVEYDVPDSRGIARMTSISDRNDNVMQFEYDSLGRLERVIDTLGREIDYAYDSSSRLTQVTDFSGRIITLAYDANGDLESVTTPAVTGTPNGNDFPTGKTTVYTYDSGTGERLLNHNLLTVTAPNEEAVVGPARLQVLYDTDPTSDDFDRVLTLTAGGTNANGIPAGGTINYDYSVLDPAPPDPVADPFSRTTVTDRNGNATEYDFNQLGNILALREQTNRNIRPGDPASYDATYTYNADGELLSGVLPHLNTIELSYDSANPERRSQGNLLSVRADPDVGRGGDQSFLTTTYEYEPIYNLTRTVIEPRGNDPSYVPQNGGAQSAARYTTTYTLDYEEGCDYAAIGAKIGRNAVDTQALLTAAGMCGTPLGDVNGDGATDQVSGNTIRIDAPTVNLLSGSNQETIEGDTTQEIAATFTYNQFGQVATTTDPEANVDVYLYYPEQDPDGDGYIDNPSGDPTTGGYLETLTLDSVSDPIRNSSTNPTPADIVTTYEYDSVGNIIRITDGRGIATDYAVNQLNQVVRITRAADVSQALANLEEPPWAACSGAPECSGMTAFSYLVDVFYDRNDNVVEVRVENSDSNNPSLAGPTVDHTYSYDILDNVIEAEREVSESPAETVVTHYRYDRNENAVLVISPEALAGTQPSNLTSYVYDERDLLFTSTRGGSTAQFDALAANADIPERPGIVDSLDISTFSYGYDESANLITATDAVDTDGSGLKETTTYLYDGFDRLVSEVDAVGNQSFYQYDPASNVVSGRVFGPVGGATPTSNGAATFTQPLTPGSFTQPLLGHTDYLYDELSRLFQKDDELFVSTGVIPVRTPVLKDGPLGTTNDGVVETRYEYDRSGRLSHVIEDDTDTFPSFYDGVDRVIERLDPQDNEVQYEYDDNSNVIRLTEIEKTSPGVSPALQETFVTTYTYDSLNRLIRTVDAIGNTGRLEYDSRNNLIGSSDAQNSSLIADPLGLFGGTINEPGNTGSYYYDGLSRRIATVMDLRVGGQGGNPIDTSNPTNPDGLIVTDYDWDANSRLVAGADDGSTAGDGNTSIGVIEPTSPLGNVTRYTYDDLNRLIQETFDDTTTNSYVYDADDNVTQMTDENGSVSDYTYDGLNRLIQANITPGPGVIGTTLQTYEYDGLNRLTLATDNNDPLSGLDDSAVMYAYDSLSRLLEEVQNGQAVSSQWDGDNNRLALIYPNSRQIDYAYDTLDRVTEITDPSEPPPAMATYSYIGPGRLLEREYANGVRLTYRDPITGADVGYDGDRRIVLHQHLDAADSIVSAFEYQYDRMDNRTGESRLHKGDGDAYTYDSVYRLVTFVRDIGGVSPSTVNYQLDGPGNWSSPGVHGEPNNMNEYSTFGGVTRTYDDNGNLTNDGAVTYEYDGLNRLVRVRDISPPQDVSTYTYDGLDRRIGKTVTNSPPFDDSAGYVYDGRMEIQSDAVVAGLQQYVGRIRLDRQGQDPLFYHEDGKGYTAALSDPLAGVAERYTYDAYGVPRFEDALNVPIPGAEASVVKNPFLFAGGQRWEPETSAYWSGSHYKPEEGRYISRSTDYLSYYQDAVPTQSYLASARERPALRSHGSNWYSYATNIPAGGGGRGGMRVRVFGTGFVPATTVAPGTEVRVGGGGGAVTGPAINVADLESLLHLTVTPRAISVNPGVMTVTINLAPTTALGGANVTLDVSREPTRTGDEPFLTPIEDVFSITGRGTVVTGRVERGVIKTGGKTGAGVGVAGSLPLNLADDPGRAIIKAGARISLGGVGYVGLTGGGGGRIRIRSGYAGGGYGGMVLPRIGQEAIVDFLEGDPDRPIIGGLCGGPETPLPYPDPDTLPPLLPYEGESSCPDDAGLVMSWGDPEPEPKPKPEPGGFDVRGAGGRRGWHPAGAGGWIPE